PIAGVIVFVWPNVFAPTIGQAFKEHRSNIAGTHRRDCFSRESPNRQDVGVINVMSRNSIGAHALAQLRSRPTLLQRRVYREGIVLTNEQNGKSMQCRKIDAFVEDAFFRSAVAKKGGDNPSFAFALEGEGVTQRDREPRAHDGGCPKNEMAHIDDMHRSAFAPCASSVFPV